MGSFNLSVSVGSDFGEFLVEPVAISAISNTAIA